MTHQRRVVRTEAADWAAVRSVRLTALADSPAAFGSTLSREIAFDENEWRRRAAGTCFLALVNGDSVGIIGGVAGTAPDEREIVSLWVAPAHRRSGVAGELIEAVCAWAHADGATSVTLRVADGNPAATRLYNAQASLLPAIPGQ